ncbi:hypothetical protein ScPMuIL_017085 [Solemya velum]
MNTGLLWALVFFTTFQFVGSSNRKLFLPDHSYHNRKPPSGRIYETETSSLESCAITCYEDDRCASFFHGPQHKCIGYPKVPFPPSDNLTVEMGWDVFRHAEKNDVPAEKNDVPAEKGWSLVGEKYYFVSHSKLNWTRAKDMCASMGGYLLEIESESEANATDELVMQRSERADYWIGAMYSSNSNQWTWVNSGNEMVYTRWVPGQPSDDGFADCVDIAWAWDRTTAWDNTPCSDSKMFLCEY